jgi:hypothetical protein
VPGKSSTTWLPPGPRRAGRLGLNYLPARDLSLLLQDRGARSATGVGRWIVPRVSWNRSSRPLVGEGGEAGTRSLGKRKWQYTTISEICVGPLVSEFRASLSLSVQLRGITLEITGSC